jgi:uncharacterized protein YdeI (YjbR/CyaY-like superfamily)
MTRLADLPLVEVAGRAEWRAWLQRNHSTSPGVWLAVGKKGNSRTTLTYDDAGLAAIEAAKADGSWQALDDVEDLVAPDDLAAALAADPVAAASAGRTPWPA